MKIRRIISILMALVLLHSFVIPSFAVSTESNVANKQDGFTYIDSDGKKNTYIVYSSEVGSSHVDYYVDGALVESVDTSIVESQDVAIEALNASSRVHIIRTDMRTGVADERTELLSNYISVNDSFSAESENVPARAATYTLQGKIIYNTHYDEISGLQINDQLFIYQSTGTPSYEYKTINSVAGTAASSIISVIAAVLTLYWAPLASLASDVLFAAASAVGVNIVGGIIQGAISKRYYVKSTEYSVKAYDLSSSRQRIYSAESYNVALEGGGYSSQTYYEGYLPWRSNTVAYNMFCDFWTYPYPGVSSYA